MLKKWGDHPKRIQLIAPPSVAKPCALALSHYYTAGCLASLRDQAPAYRKSWTSRTSDEHVVTEIPDRCLSSNRIIEQMIRVRNVS
jgi:hypothetical protein